MYEYLNQIVPLVWAEMPRIICGIIVFFLVWIIAGLIQRIMNKAANSAMFKYNVKVMKKEGHA